MNQLNPRYELIEINGRYIIEKNGGVVISFQTRKEAETYWNKLCCK